ncbi:MAG: hypothetical protein ACI841_000288, partial [Planctomycetota bacterium]
MRCSPNVSILNCHASVLENTIPSCRLRLVVSEYLDRLAI